MKESQQEQARRVRPIDFEKAALEPIFIRASSVPLNAALACLSDIQITTNELKSVLEVLLSVVRVLDNINEVLIFAAKTIFMHL